MEDNIGTVIYFGGYFLSLRWTVAALIWGSKSSFNSRPDGGDLVFGGFFGALASLIWPLSGPLAYMYLNGGAGNGRRFDQLFPPPKSQREILAKAREQEQRLEIARLEREIRELERM